MLWIKNVTLEDLKPFMTSKNMVQLLGIEVTEIGDDYIKGRMPVDERTHQVNGYLHGGASCVLVETLGSIASLMCIDMQHKYALGSEINVNHISSIRSGAVVATCKPVHVGRQKHVWDIWVRDESNDRLIAKGELTCAVVDRRAE